MPGVPLDVLVIGGGVAGLWTLASLRQAGCQALLVEGFRLGTGQTIASQGILHSGLKYSLAGVLTAAAREAREMPALWRQCLAGQAYPNLSRVQVSAQAFHLWGTQSAGSRLGLLGAQMGLKVTPQAVPASELPQLLRGCPGSVYRVNEQVLEPASLIEGLARPVAESIVRVDPQTELEFETLGPGRVRQVHLHAARAGLTQSLQPKVVVLLAGRGNAGLRDRLQLDRSVMQLRPLHYVLLRGALPEFHGHCVDFHRTRVSITSARDSQGRVVWQVGGQISEVGVAMSSDALIQHTRAELQAVFPALDLTGTEWTTCRVDRAEGTTATGSRPDSYRLFEEGNVLTGWPTKLVLAPQLAAEVVRRVGRVIPLRGEPVGSAFSLPGWPRPEVARPAWEEIRNWVALPGEIVRRRAA
ncbi:MAG: FAD-dependent oxidoreductase [Planctomycetaceae bacterium]